MYHYHMRPMFCVLNTKTLKRLHILGCGSIWKHWHQWYHSKAYNFIVQWHDESYITSHAYYSKKNYRNIDENLSKSWRVLPRNKDKRQEGKKQNDDMRITKKKKKGETRIQTLPVKLVSMQQRFGKDSFCGSSKTAK